MGIIESIIDIFIFGLLVLYIIAGLFSHMLRMIFHVLFGLLSIYAFLYGADQLVAAVPAIEELGLSDNNTRAAATGVLIVVVLLLSWFFRSIIDDTGDGGFMSMLSCCVLGLVRGSMLVWLLIFAVSYLPRSWGAGIWDSSAMIRHFSAGLQNTLIMLPTLEDSNSYLKRLEFDEITSQPLLKESVIEQINETISDQVEQLRDTASATVTPSTRIRLLREQLEARQNQRTEARQPVKPTVEAGPSEDAEPAAAFKDKLAEMLGSDEDDLDESEREELARLRLLEQRMAALGEQPGDGLLDYDRQGLGREQVIAKLKQKLRDDPGAADSQLSRTLINALEVRQNHADALDLILAED